MGTRGRASTRLRGLRTLVAGAGLTVLLSAGTIPAMSGAALAADQRVTVAPGSEVGPVPAAIGDVILVEGANVTVTDLDVPDVGILSELVVTTVASPATVPCETSGLITETIGFSYGSVLSPTDVPEQAVLDALTARPLAGATLQVQVAEPPPPPPPPPPPVDPPPVDPPGVDPPPVDPPGIEQPGADRADSGRPTTVSVDREAGQLPPELTGAVPAPSITVGGSRSMEPESGVGGPTGGLRSAFGVLSGPEAPAAAAQPIATAAARDDLPMALSVPSLLALMAICVVGAGVGRFQHWSLRRTR